MAYNNQMTIMTNYNMSLTSAGVASPAAPGPAYLLPLPGPSYPPPQPGPSYLLPPPPQQAYLLPPPPPPPAYLKPPPGYHFKPTDVELIKYYLAKKVKNEPIPISEISSVDIYKHHPYDLGATYPQLDENVWYYFTPRDRRYPNGKRPNRSTEAGKWKTTGKDIEIKHDNKVIGYKRVLVYYDRAKKTDWLMHEYRLDEPSRPPKNDHKDMRLDDCVLCRIYHKKTKNTGQVQINNESRELAIVEASPVIEENMMNAGDEQMRMHDNNLGIQNGANYGIYDQTTWFDHPITDDILDDLMFY
ncbi:hypothetical protein CASFOL_035299 [Castilleja foliolosa]|uniref:NAC domain-containing protein n=1 Tax=Castilleja foliolosa TaxID=1961234 RepID=A0ABD3BUK5_9LAMI